MNNKNQQSNKNSRATQKVSQKTSNSKFSVFNIIIASISLVASYISLHIGHSITLVMIYDIPIMTAIEMWNHNIQHNPLVPFSTLFSSLITFAVVFIINFAIFMFYIINKDKRRNFHRRKEEHGSAKFAQVSDFTHFKDGEYSQNIIISKDIMLSIKHHETGINLNFIIIGGPGSGKTRYFIKPNILNLGIKKKGVKSPNIIITDPKGEILASTGNFLKSQGYKINVINLREITQSDYYNPFHYMDLSKPDDVIMLIDTIMKSTNKSDEKNKGGGSNDTFWENAEKMMLQALFFYILETEPPERQNISTLLKLLSENKFKSDASNQLAEKFEKLKTQNSRSLAAAFWGLSDGGNAETMQTVTSIINSRFSLFMTISDMLEKDTLELNKIDERKTAIFVIMSPTKPALNFVATLFYTQLFQQIDYIADKNSEEHNNAPIALKRQTLFLLDEFANIPKIPNFMRMLAYARSLNVGMMPIFQSLVQAKEMYSDAWETLIDSCDNFLYLGGNQSNFSTKYISEMLGKETIDMKVQSVNYQKGRKVNNSASVIGRPLLTPDEIGRMPKIDAIYKLSSKTPIINPKYDLTSHINYKELSETSFENDDDLDEELKAGLRIKNNQNPKIKTLVSSYQHYVPEWSIKNSYVLEVDISGVWIDEFSILNQSKANSAFEATYTEFNLPHIQETINDYNKDDFD